MLSRLWLKPPRQSLSHTEHTIWRKSLLAVRSRSICATLLAHGVSLSSTFPSRLSMIWNLKIYFWKSSIIFWVCDSLATPLGTEANPTRVSHSVHALAWWLVQRFTRALSCLINNHPWKVSSLWISESYSVYHIFIVPKIFSKSRDLPFLLKREIYRC